MIYSITNPQGATIRIGSTTGAGILRKAPLGSKFRVSGVIKTDAGRNRWLLLDEIDPETGNPWRYQGAEVSAYIALYHNGTTYAVPVESEGEPETPGTYSQGYNDGWNAHYAAVQFVNPGRR
jgi:hypothetical protein